MNEILPVSASDLTLIDEVERSCFPGNPWSIESLRASILRDRSICLAAFVDGDVVGYALASCAAPEAEMLKVAVLPGYRRQGIGQRLVRAMTKTLGRTGCHEVFLECRASNHAAINMYGSLGFEETGRRKGYYTDTKEDAVIMRQAHGG
ncbi:MAG: ribosomal protein S18-alanine N-acetyltransferase [Thermodesulfovibrionales bacterium]|nr:ribosomal protein S18-alanine N-acetyltransferase [Thermodesulfovibrionales bacterium]